MTEKSVAQTSLAELEREASSLKGRLSRLLDQRAAIDREASGMRERLAVLHREIGRIYETEGPKTIQRGFIKNLDPGWHRVRTVEGLAAARAEGKRPGRRPSISADKWAEFDRLLLAGVSVRAAATATGISHSHAQRRAHAIVPDTERAPEPDPIGDDLKVSNG
jgi:hypothetical protein